ncbi:MAG: hypothetical protein ACRYGP_03495 [Janthinobacterium lividum]
MIPATGVDPAMIASGDPRYIRSNMDRGSRVATKAEPLPIIAVQPTEASIRLIERITSMTSG